MWCVRFGTLILSLSHLRPLEDRCRNSLIPTWSQFVNFNRIKHNRKTLDVRISLPFCPGVRHGESIACNIHNKSKIIQAVWSHLENFLLVVAGTIEVTTEFLQRVLWSLNNFFMGLDMHQAQQRFLSSSVLGRPLLTRNPANKTDIEFPH